MTAEDFDRPSLTDVAYKEIRNSILVGGMSPGDKLVVNDLVDRWKISNTPIKEALNRLVAEGLVEAVPRRGMRVRLVTARELREFFEIRALYEVHCCDVAVERMDDHPHIEDQMAAALARSREILDDAGTYLVQFELDGLFHQLIVGMSGNEMLIKNFDRIHANILTVGIHASKKAPLRRQDETYHEHSRILDGLLRRSAADAREAMREHLANTLDDLLRYYHPESGRFLADPHRRSR